MAKRVWVHRGLSLTNFPGIVLQELVGVLPRVFPGPPLHFLQSPHHFVMEGTARPSSGHLQAPTQGACPLKVLLLSVSLLTTPLLEGS